MPHPVYSKPPSESTIEQLSNHHLLNHLGPSNSWFFVPTRNEEQLLGYDASLQGYKTLIIQYKRFAPHKAIGSGRIDLNVAQHRNLVSRFPAANNPYVFFGFSQIRSYADLSTMYQASLGNQFGDEMIYVDAHGVPVGKRSISTRLLAGLTHGDMNGLVSLMLSCKVGLMHQDLESTFCPPSKREVGYGRVSILRARIRA